MLKNPHSEVSASERLRSDLSIAGLGHSIKILFIIPHLKRVFLPALPRVQGPYMTADPKPAAVTLVRACASAVSGKDGTSGIQ
jgi:hypothetical protein